MILRWEGTASERSAFSELKRRGKESIPDYRRILNKARLYAVGSAAMGLVEIGDPNIDIPLIIDALERIRSYKEDYFVDDSIEEVLQKALGISLPRGTSVEDWRKSWEEKKKKAEHR